MFSHLIIAAKWTHSTSLSHLMIFSQCWMLAYSQMTDGWMEVNKREGEATTTKLYYHQKLPAIQFNANGKCSQVSENTKFIWWNPFGQTDILSQAKLFSHIFLQHIFVFQQYSSNEASSFPEIWCERETANKILLKHTSTTKLFYLSSRPSSLSSHLTSDLPRFFSSFLHFRRDD